jgi:hypothetical protein
MTSQIKMTEERARAILAAYQADDYSIDLSDFSAGGEPQEEVMERASDAAEAYLDRLLTTVTGGDKKAL